jgi:CheY-like chemotaxis protein
LPGDNNKTEQGLKPGQYLELRVSDTGEGMNQNQLSQIFDPFYTTKKKGEGTGLGLSVVHGIVTKTGGNIAVKSSPGQGTTFTLLLPEVEKSTPRQSASDDSIDLPTGTERILMVDDEITLLEMTKEYLTLLGYQLISCSDSRNALDIFHKQPDFFDLVITDQTMPDIPGDQLVGEILKIRPDIPIILNTGFSESINEDKARAIGIRTYLLKPVPMETLAATIRCVLDTPESQLSVRCKRMAATLC